MDRPEVGSEAAISSMRQPERITSVASEGENFCSVLAISIMDWEELRVYSPA
jgi:hypothetical protein